MVDPKREYVQILLKKYSSDKILQLGLDVHVALPVKLFRKLAS